VELLVRAAGSQLPGLSTETGKRLEATLNPTARAGHAQAPSVAMGRADRRGASRHAVAPASVAGERVGAAGFTAAEAGMAAEAGIGNRSFVMFQVV